MTETDDIVQRLLDEGWPYEDQDEGPLQIVPVFIEHVGSMPDRGYSDSHRGARRAALEFRWKKFINEP